MLPCAIAAAKASTPCSNTTPRPKKLSSKNAAGAASKAPRKVNLLRLSKVAVAQPASQQGPRGCQYCFASATIACAWDDGQAREDILTHRPSATSAARRRPPLLLLLSMLGFCHTPDV